MGELVAHTEQLVLRVPNLGKKGLAEITTVLAERGLKLADPDARDGTPPLPFPTVAQRLTWIEARLSEIERKLKP